MSRWLENGDKKLIGQIIFALFLLAALAVLFFGCCGDVPINIQKSIKNIRGYDHMEPIPNYWVKDDDVFKAYVEALALTRMHEDGWARYAIVYLTMDELNGGKRISFAFIYYWRER